MKKYILIILVLFFTLTNIERVDAQFRTYLELSGVSNGANIPNFSGSEAITNVFGEPIDGGCCEEDNGFNFTLNFNDLSILIALQNAIATAQQAAVIAWLGRQEETFRQEINRQLGSNYQNFWDAQNAFFKDYERNRLNVNRIARNLASQELQKAAGFDREQVIYTEEFLFLDQWQANRQECSSEYAHGFLCDNLRRQRVQGRWLTTLRNQSDIDRYRGYVLQDFSKKEMDAATSRSCHQGLINSANNDFFVNRFATNHRTNYYQKGLQDRVELMIAYLTIGNLNPPLNNPLASLIPQFWNNSTLINLGKDNGPTLSLDERVFDNNFLNAVANGAFIPSIHPSALPSLLARRQNVIDRHIDDLRFFELPQIGKGRKIDPKQELKCFDRTKPAKLTIYIEQANPGTRDLVGQNQVGHVFVGIEQGTIRRLFGYYPTENSTRAGVLLRTNYAAILRENSGHNYDVKIEKDITSLQLTKIILEAEKFHATYNLENYACVDFGIEIGNLGGMNLPNITYSGFAYNIYPYEGRIPGGLAEDVMSSVNNVNGTATRETKAAPSSRGNCN